MAMTGPDSQPRKPVILTVDDDPAVSRAVARDLRRHYGERYRIVRAESGPDALETTQRTQASRRRRRGVRRRLPDAGHERHRVPRRGHGHLSAGPPRAADRLRRHACRDRRHQRRRPRSLPAQAVGSARGEALPGDRRPSRGVARAGRPRDSRHQGHRAPVESPVVGGAPVPRPQPALVPQLHGRRVQGQAAARRRGPRRPAAARGDHRGRRDARRADQRRAGRHARAVDLPVAGDVRARRHRRWPRRSRRGGVRRIRGSQDRAHREHDDGRAGGAQLADRELPRLPHRHLGRRAHHVGTQAGRDGSAPRSSPPARPSASTSAARPGRSNSRTAARSARRP